MVKGLYLNVLQNASAYFALYRMGMRHTGVSVLKADPPPPLHHNPLFFNRPEHANTSPKTSQTCNPPPSTTIHHFSYSALGRGIPAFCACLPISLNQPVLGSSPSGGTNQIAQYSAIKRNRAGENPRPCFVLTSLSRAKPQKTRLPCPFSAREHGIQRNPRRHLIGGEGVGINVHGGNNARVPQQFHRHLWRYPVGGQIRRATMA